jgi:sigma-E factor negative regulatory protein RseC
VVKFQTVEEIGVIEHENGLHATVLVTKREACEGCSLKTCKTDGHTMTIEALTPIHARVGQRVKLSIKSRDYLISTVIVYGIPAAALLFGAVVGREIAGNYFLMQDPDVVTAVSGLTACVLSFVSVKIWSRMAGRQDAPKPVIEEILES